MSEATLPVEAAAPRPSEDLVAVGLGLAVFLASLPSLAGVDALARLVTTSLVVVFVAIEVLIPPVIGQAFMAQASRGWRCSLPSISSCRSARSARFQP